MTTLTEAAQEVRAMEGAKHTIDCSDSWMRVKGLPTYSAMVEALKDAHAHIADDDLRAKIGAMIAKVESAK